MFGIIGLGDYLKWKKRRENPKLKPNFLSNLKLTYYICLTIRKPLS